MKTEFLTRFYPTNFEFREDETVGIIEGRPIVYNSRTDLGFFDEIIESGALDETDLRDVRLCLNHDTSFVYARSRNNNENSTMQIFVDENGLRFRAKLDIKNSPKAQDFYSAVKRGDIDKMSFMFSVRDDDWSNLDSDHPTRTIKKIGTVVEVSAVTFPAYDTTEIQARSKETLDNVRSALDSARRSALDSVELEKLKAKYLYNL